MFILGIVCGTLVLQCCAAIQVLSVPYIYLLDVHFWCSFVPYVHDCIKLVLSAFHAFQCFELLACGVSCIPVLGCFDAMISVYVVFMVLFVNVMLIS